MHIPAWTAWETAASQSPRSTADSEERRNCSDLRTKFVDFAFGRLRTLSGTRRHPLNGNAGDENPLSRSLPHVWQDWLTFQVEWRENLRRKRHVVPPCEVGLYGSYLVFKLCSIFRDYEDVHVAPAICLPASVTPKDRYRYPRLLKGGEQVLLDSVGEFAFDLEKVPESLEREVIPVCRENIGSPGSLLRCQPIFNKDPKCPLDVRVTDPEESRNLPTREFLHGNGNQQLDNSQSNRRVQDLVEHLGEGYEGKLGHMVHQQSIWTIIGPYI